MSLLFGSTKPLLVSVYHSDDPNSDDEIRIDQKIWDGIVSSGDSLAGGRVAVKLEPTLASGLQSESPGIHCIISWAQLDSQVSWSTDKPIPVWTVR
jgi:hypothetical protein